MICGGDVQSETFTVGNDSNITDYINRLNAAQLAGAQITVCTETDIISESTTK